MPVSESQIRFVHARLRGAAGAVSLSDQERAELIAAGVLEESDGALQASGTAREWLRKARAEREAPPPGDPEAASAPCPQIGPLTRRKNGRPPFLAPHHVAAAGRVQRLFERAHLRQRVTMHYSPAAGLGGRPGAGASDIADMAAAARKTLADIHQSLPRDCAGVVIDVCGYEKGLQAVEAERGWPRRSAKLVLRIGLEQLASYFGLMPDALGPEIGQKRGWMDATARPVEFG